MMAWFKNPGRLPGMAKGKRVHVILEGGYTTVGKEASGWPADGQYGCNWAIKNHPAAIKGYEVI